jgi:hypothetical protein
LHVCPLQYSSRTLPATQFKLGLLADKLSEVQMSYFYLCLSVCQYLWIIKFLEWAYRKKGGIWGGIFIDWDIEGSFFVWFYYVFRLYSSYICLFANHTGWSWVSDSGHYLTTGFSRLVTFNPHVVVQLFRWLKTQMVELLIGFVCFCGLSLLNAPWSTVPLLLPLFGSVPTDLA